MNLQGIMLNEKVSPKGRLLWSYLNVIIEVTKLEIDNRVVFASG